MMAKTPIGGDHCEDLLENFQRIRKYNMRLKSKMGSTVVNSLD